MLPRTSRIKCSNSLKISEEGWWIVETTLTPHLDRCLRSSITERAVEESSPVVGSSRKSIEGFVSSSTPIEVRFLSPPEIPLIISFPTYVFAHFWIPSSTISDSTFSFRYLGERLGIRRLAMKLNASRGEKVANRISSCIT